MGMRLRPAICLLTGWALLCIGSVQAAGTFHYGTSWVDPNREETDFPFLRDSLGFNIVRAYANSCTIDSFAKYSLSAMVSNCDDEYSPFKRASHSHYIVWEPERYPESNYQLEYEGGTMVDDSHASGGKAMLFDPLRGDKPGTIQEGPWYPQQYLDGMHPIQYHARFRLKSPLSNPRKSRGGSYPDSLICFLKVLGDSETLAKDTVYCSDFQYYLGYKDFELTYEASKNPIEYQIYWTGNRLLYVDCVKVYDNNGWDLVEDSTHTAPEQIQTYVDSAWVHTTFPSTDDTVVCRWYLQDEPWYIDVLEPARYIDSLLREVSPERVGYQIVNQYTDDVFVEEYFLRHDPQEYFVDIYPTRYWGLYFTGEEFQQGVDSFTTRLSLCKNRADEQEKDLWVTIQTNFWGDQVPDQSSCAFGPAYDYDGKWYCSPLLRPPTGNEVRLQTFLALCYGANSILHFNYGSFIDTGNPDLWKLRLGMYDHMADTTTEMWREIAHFSSPRAQVLGPVINELAWLGGCLHDTVGSFVLRDQEASYIDSIVGTDPESTCVQVGFFEDAEANRCFMLVNRRTLESQSDDVQVHFSLPDGPYLATDMYEDDIPLGKFCGFTPLEVELQPGEGRLIKLEKCIYKLGYVFWVPGDFDRIQDAIDASWWYTTILVEPGTYYENLRFKDHNPTVTSYLHLYPDSTWFIENTIIDGCSLTCGPDSASVVRFVDNDHPTAVLKGFTIRNGKGTEYIQKGEINDCGGGIYCYYSSPTIINNIITADTAIYGGGIYCCNSSPQILNNMIVENAADSGYGGGIAIENFQQPYSGPIVVNNVIASNSAGIRGGGIYYAGQPIVTNNTVDLNSAEGDGGGIFVNMAYGGRIENNIVTNSQDGGGLRGYSEADLIAYNDVWNNTEGNFSAGYLGGVGDTTCDSTNRNGTPCDAFHNIVRNPLFYDGYHLDDESECVNAGDNEAMYVPPADFEGNQRVKDEWVDMGAYENQGGGRAGGGAKYAAGNQSGNGEASASTPYSFALPQNYPNPFNPVTNISFSVGGDKSASQVTLKIYNIVGQLVRTMVDDVRMPGSYVVAWDGRDSKGKEVASGIYFYRLKAAEFTECRKMVLLK
jgi:hypothetical protein